jgi:two-component system sensor histidine kinase PilS (NtrC family)
MPIPLSSEPAWAPLLEAVEQAFALGRWPDARRELKFGDGRAPRLVLARARFTRRGDIAEGDGQPEEICVLFLEDMRHVQERVRQEKLAAMGRMSAGISHEIRNPLAAIAQANALLIEDTLDPAQQRLTRIVEDNVARLTRIVDDVLTVAPTQVVTVQALDATAQAHQICEEWARTARLGTGDDDGRVALRLPSQPLRVMFDVDHLRRVLVNLLDNARRHGTDRAGAVLVELAEEGDAVVLTVGSDGAAIPPDVERHLFEPFFSTRSRGTGLGLYICRELCERFDATIEYRSGAVGARHHNLFRVSMRRVK